jgi:hypothetical protein
VLLGVTSIGSGGAGDRLDVDDERMGIDLWMPGLRVSAKNGLRWIDSVADAMCAEGRDAFDVQ